MEKGKIIWLNGVSSSGKTTLAKMLQEKLDEQFFHLDKDAFTYIMRMTDKCYERIDWTKTEDKIISAFNKTIKAFSDLGFNTIVDRLFLREFDYLNECVELFNDYPVLFVHVICPLEELRRREKQRGDRVIGQSEEQLPELIPQDKYDIIVDTHNNTIEECADRIIEALNYPENFTAFKTLYSERFK
ncbi:MAG: chloramphenicol phosphotransferase CPT family protein [Oscillospiraceae bacterium]|nr:chloramphenicol phosphotransferase CPT family protein [Oscillospiraceae bacterium]